MAPEDVKVTAMNMYNYKEGLRFCKRWPCIFIIISQTEYLCHRKLSLAAGGRIPSTAMFNTRIYVTSSSDFPVKFC